MVDSLAKIIAGFPGEANRSRCLAHIVNLVVKIILRQFDVTKKKVKKNGPFDDTPSLANDSNADEDERDMIPNDEDAVDEMERELDKEEKEMDEGAGEEDGNEDSEALEKDVEMVEEAMREEIKEVAKLVKPVHQVLYKVGPFFFFLSVLLFFFCFASSSFFFPPSPPSFFFYSFIPLFPIFPPTLSFFYIRFIPLYYPHRLLPFFYRRLFFFLYF